MHGWRYPSSGFKWAKAVVRLPARPESVRSAQSESTQYAARDYRKRLKARGIMVSMSRKGDCCLPGPPLSPSATRCFQQVAEDGQGQTTRTSEIMSWDFANDLQAIMAQWTPECDSVGVSAEFSINGLDKPPSKGNVSELLGQPSKL